MAVCGALRKLRLAKQARFLQTAALAAPSLDLPLAALGLAARLEPPVLVVSGNWHKNMGYPVGVSHILAYITQFDTMQRLSAERCIR